MTVEKSIALDSTLIIGIILTRISICIPPGLAQLCQLAYLKVLSLDEDYVQEAALNLSESTLVEPKEFKAVIEMEEKSKSKELDMCFLFETYL
ncbi:nuclease [Artemisia annua]|uniref:Nuclease n=1 Tax=Artemisia annua TaxID=35608 RepID=A0A2U1KYX4_ARTAN|nr:nuclease [Artemisia annua]